MSLLVIRPGLLTLIQDLGRWGWQRFGVVVGGAADPFCARVANVLVGNPEEAAVVEMVMTGPCFRVERPVLVALCGAGFALRVGGRLAPVDRPVAVLPGEKLEFEPQPSGARAWLAVSGGIDVPAVLGSRTTYLRGKFGGFEGRALRAGDRLALGASSPWAEATFRTLSEKRRRFPAWSVRPETLASGPTSAVVRAMRGPEWDRFTGEARRTLFSGIYRATRDIDRMGLRLEGPALEQTAPREEISSAVGPGVIQVPGSAQPVVLLANRQTIGGYARIAVVAQVDIGVLAQIRPGDELTFEEIRIPEAQSLLLERERNLARVKAGIGRLAG